jgi:hypothetical protein
MAVILDESAQAAIEARRRRGKNDRIYLRLERGSLRASTPLVLAVGWMPPTVPDELVVHRCPGNVEVYMGLRVARYVRSCDVVVSGLHLWRWHRLVLADPFAYEHLREWECGRRAAAPARVLAATSSMAAGRLFQAPGRVLEANGAGPRPAADTLAAPSAVPPANLGSATDGRDT